MNSFISYLKIMPQNKAEMDEAVRQLRLTIEAEPCLAKEVENHFNVMAEMHRELKPFLEEAKEK